MVHALMMAFSYCYLSTNQGSVALAVSKLFSSRASCLISISQLLFIALHRDIFIVVLLPRCLLVSLRLHGSMCILLSQVAAEVSAEEHIYVSNEVN